MHPRRLEGMLPVVSLDSGWRIALQDEYAKLIDGPSSAMEVAQWGREATQDAVHARGGGQLEGTFPHHHHELDMLS